MIELKSTHMSILKVPFVSGKPKKGERVMSRPKPIDPTDEIRSKLWAIFGIQMFGFCFLLVVWILQPEWKEYVGIALIGILVLPLPLIMMELHFNKWGSQS